MILYRTFGHSPSVARAVASWVLAAALGCGSGPPPIPAGAPEPTGPATQVESAPEPPPEPPPPDLRHAPPTGFVDLTEAIPGIVLSIGYHRPDNFTGAPLPGYGVPGAWLHEVPAAALAKVQSDLAKDGYGLVIFDAYRPARATAAMVAWAKRTGQMGLIEGGYISSKSEHNRGTAVDLGLVTLADGALVDMGTPWDTLSEASHTSNATGGALAQRLRLKAAMARHGWRNYWREWWHFGFTLDPKPERRDVPYACFERDEGAFTAPAGWDKPGWTPPSTWPDDARCP